MVALSDGLAPGVDIGDWVDAYGSTHPVLHDQELTVRDVYMNVGGGSPHYTLIDREMTIVWKGNGPAGHTEAEQLIVAMLANE